MRSKKGPFESGYCSPTADRVAESWLLTVPQTTPAGDRIEVPQITPKPVRLLLPHTTEVPQTTELPVTLLPQTTDVPQTTEDPQHTELLDIHELPFRRFTFLAEELYETLGDKADPTFAGARSLLASAAATSRYPAPTVNIS